MRKWFFMMLLTILLFISISNVVDSKQAGKIGPGVLSVKKEKIPVIIEYKDSEKVLGIFSVKKRKKDVIDSFNIKHIEHNYKLSNAVSAQVTKKELLSLENNPYVEKVYKDRQVHALLDDSVPLVNGSLAHGLQYNLSNLTGKGQTVCVIDTGVDYTHDYLGNCSIVNYVLNGTIKNLTTPVQSSHPYDNNENKTLKINYSGFENIAVHFANISLEYQGEVSGYDTNDRIIIYDSGHREIANYHGINGTIEDLWSPYSEGDTIYIKLKTDSLEKDYGFYIDKIINGTTNTTYNWSNCSKVIGGWDFVNNDGDPIDDEGHGTHVAGIVAGTHPTYKGVAPGVNLVAAKALDSSESGWFSDITYAMEFCINRSSDLNISVISMSIGTETAYSSICDSTYPYISDAINEAVNKDIIVTIASGNGYNRTAISSPACIDNATSVAASTKSDSIASYSNLADLVDLLAPGSSITSTWMKGGFGSMSGTSMATPHVSGATALLQQYSQVERGQNLTAFEVETALKESDMNISDYGYTYPRLEVFDSLQYLDDTKPNLTLHKPRNITYNYTVPLNFTVFDFLLETCWYVVNGSKVDLTDCNSTEITVPEGSHNLVLYANDSTGNENNKTSSFSLNTPPAITPNNFQNYSVFLPGSVLNITVNDSDGVDKVWWFNTTENETLNNGSKPLYYMNLSLLEHGWGNISIYANDTKGILRDVIFIVGINNPPELTNNISINMTEDVSYNFSISSYFNDTDNDNLTYSYFNITNITIGITNNTVNITPDNNFYGLVNVTFYGNDSFNITESNVVEINITPVNDLPQLHLENQKQTKGYSFSYQLNATDIENDNLTFDLVNITNLTSSPINFTIVNNNTLVNNSGINNVGVFEIRINVTDGLNTSEGFFNITVNLQPVATKFSSSLTTNFSEYNNTEIQILENVSIGVSNKGLVNYSSHNHTLNLSILNLDDYVNISYNHIELNSAMLPELNISATLFLYNLSFSDPVIQRNGKDCSICQENYYDENGTLSFNVTHFTTYSAKEYSVSQDTQDGNGGSGSAGGGGTSTKKNIHSWSEVIIGEKYSMEITNNALKKIYFWSDKDSSDVKITVESVGNVSEKPKGRIYSYFNISSENLDLDKGVLIFEVNKTWINNKEKIILKKYNKKWTGLKTENMYNSTYNATTYTFSSFAITSETTTTTSSSTTTTSTTTTTTRVKGEEKIEDRGVSIFIGFVVILILFLLGLYEHHKNRKKDFNNYMKYI